jgi:hypothetical protein
MTRPPNWNYGDYGMHPTVYLCEKHNKPHYGICVLCRKEEEE